MTTPFRVAAIVGALAAATLALSAALVPGSSAGFIASVKNSTDTAATAPFFTCAGALANDSAPALFVLPLNEASNATTATDTDSGAYPGTYRGSMTTSTSTPQACSRDTGGAYVLNGSTSYVSTATSFANPQTFSEEIWFKTTTAGGKLIGFGSSQTGASGSYDRHLYVDTTGKLVFGTYNGATKTITSTAAVNDGAWHQAVGTFSTAAGMSLYLDGTLVASNSTYTVAQNFTGYWRIGYDSLSGWPNAAANGFFTGSLRFASVYTAVLTPAQVAQHWNAGR
ncbi:concanavalin A-like lectin/glucanase superfamily protein [Frondihabitans sp. PhB188]|uniref:LamG domain-containing protein n=1 Tax=Frondihabitans sp. PhB188 TaxID=2485200 RepID=UPI000F48A486|nr:LamG domain-containing protein [Frondihabitans sp. PhB188]ROQ39543.1 concanavalin A-like lectin/glucanase superfamily protein [Frondihabitans sp. PhB188]